MNELIWQPQDVVVWEGNNQQGIVTDSDALFAVVSFQDGSIKQIPQTELYEERWAYLLTSESELDARHPEWGLLNFSVPYALMLPDLWHSYEWLQNITEDLVFLFNSAIHRNYPVLLYKVDTNVMAGVLSLLPEYQSLKIGIVVATANKFDRIYWLQDKQ